ncbi:MAG TPA: IS66 family insertion sequence element accessory protein TnpB [Polyangiaceae bacterium]|jgi:transposase
MWLRCLSDWAASVFLLPPSVRIFIATEPVDLRKGFEGLGAIVRTGWGRDLYSGHLFVFLGRRLDRCKILYFDRGGLVLYYKRLERGGFRLPPRGEDARAVEMDGTQLAMLLDGIDVAKVERPKHWRPKRSAA